MNPAYAYIYDDFLTDRRYQDIVAALETRLSSMSLDGKIGRLALFRSAKELVEGFVDQGATNIIIVGNDNTLNKVMWFLPDLPIVVGYIPIAEPSDVATLLNVPVGLDACEAIGARLIESLDVGKLGDRYFLTQAVFENTTAKVKVNNAYTLSIIGGGTIRVKNLGSITRGRYTVADARDGRLEITMIPHEPTDIGSRIRNRLGRKKQNRTRIQVQQAEIVSEQPVEVQADRFAVSGFKFSVQAVPGKLKIITGRMRRLR
jgi:diacylglycerol kinase family enzyme